MGILQNLGFFAKLSLAIGLVPLLMAIAYVVRPTERRLAMMRPCSLAGLFAALAGGVVGIVSVLRGIGMTTEFTANTYRLMALGASEALAATFFGFACLSFAWLLVAAGMSRDRGQI